ncbi:glycosyltransferase family 4 protein [Mangrovibacterium sp.]|uniref:glycosyltransferase family 4 protein n=1 Tax=Mangrovibacterium sp. TaxID=1961364 RepID=UPI0035635570
MRIFYDFYEIAQQKGHSIGIYNFAVAFLRELSSDGTVEIVLACSEQNAYIAEGLSNVELLVIGKEYPNRFKRLYWRGFYALKQAKKTDCDIYYSPKGFAPGFFKREKKPFIVLTMHDAIPFYYRSEFPKYFGWFESFFIPLTLSHSVKIANTIITISEFSKKMIEKYCGSDQDIKVIYNGVDLQLSESRKSKSDYIFSITSNLPHKNKVNLLEGYLRYRESVEKPLPLKLCGIRNEELDSKYQEQGIECFGYVDDSKLQELYANARLFLFLPLIEGFGFPPLEAMSLGVPSLVSDIPVLREVLEDAACFVDPEQPQKIGKAIQSSLVDHEFKRRFLQKSEEMISRYSWENNILQAIQVFRKLKVDDFRMATDKNG